MSARRMTRINAASRFNTIWRFFGDDVDFRVHLRVAKGFLTFGLIGDANLGC